MEKNVAGDRQAAMEMVRVSRQQGVPVILLGDDVVVGFDQRRLRELVGRSRPRLGATVGDSATQARRQPGLPASGAYVGGVRPNTPAEQAGLRTGDVITALGGQAVRDANHLHTLLRDLPRGRDVSLRFVRNGQSHDTTVRL